MPFLFIYIIFTSFAKPNTIFFEDIPQCSSGNVDTNCKTINTEFTQLNPLTSHFQNFVSNANISFQGCTFKNFQSQITNVAGIIYISNEHENPYFAFFQNCRFESNHLSSPILSILKVQADFNNDIFADNIIYQGSMIRLVGQNNFMFTCQFSHNTLKDQLFSFQSEHASSLISLSDNAFVHIQNCCFLVELNNANNFALNTDANSKIMISQNTVFNCPINKAFFSHHKSTNSFIFDETTVYSSNKCNINIYNSNSTDPENPPDDDNDKEKKISKYLYIGIGAAAGAIVLGVIIFLLFRIGGKCKKLESKSAAEGLELEEKRSSYLLQEGDQGEEILPKENGEEKKD